MAVLLPLFTYSQGDPAGVAGYSLWVKADAGTGATSTGDAVSTWTGQGSLDMVQASTGAPTYVETWANFNPGVNFTSDWMRLSTNTENPYGNSNSYSEFLVVEYPTSGAANLVGSTTGGGSNAVYGTYFPNGGQINHIHQYQSGGFINDDAVIHPDADGGEINVVESSFDGSAGGSFGSGTGNVNLGASNGENSVNYSSFPSGFEIGASRNGAFVVSNATFGEVILYDTKPSDTDIQKVNSYLTIKYGSPAQGSLVNPSGTVIYDFVAAGAYTMNIGGIGKDAHCLNQKQTKVNSSDALVTIGAGNMIAATNAANSSVIADDNYLIWGANLEAIAWTIDEAPANRQTLDKEWKIEETGDVGSVKIRIPDNSSGASTTLPSEETAVYMLYDADGDFSSGAIEVPMTLVGDNWEVDYDFPASGYYTFATEYVEPPLPAGVDGFSLWVKADDGTSSMTDGDLISTWENQGGDVSDPTQALASSQPTYVENWSNFQPAVHFTNDFLNSPEHAWGTGGYTEIMAVEYGAAGQLLGSNGPGTSNAVYGTYAPNTGSIQHVHQYSFVINDVAVTHNDADVDEVNVVESSFESGTGMGTTNAGTSNGEGAVTYTSFPSGTDIGGFRNGAFTTPDAHFGELLIYPEKLDADDIAKLNTYIGIKYGITLLNDYVAPDGTILWDVGATGGYDNMIAGIGNDGYCLNQKQSTSNNDDIVTIGAGQITDLNKNNSAVIKKDNYKLWGNDGGSTTIFDMIATNSVNKMDRQWLFSEEGEVGQVLIQVPAADIPVPAGEMAYLIVSGDDTIDGADAFYEMTLNGANYEILINCSDADYFTFGYGPEIEVSLSLAKSSSATSAASGDNIMITTTITNDGPTGATGVKVKDLVPVGMTLNSATPSVGTYNPTTGIWFIPSLPPGDATLTFDLTVQ